MADLKQIPERVVVINPAFFGMTEREARRKAPKRMTERMRHWFDWVMRWSPKYSGLFHWDPSHVTDEEVIRAIKSRGPSYADLSQTPGNVVTVSPSTVPQKTSNAAVVAGNCVVADSSGNYGPGNATGTAVTSGSLGVGIAATSAPGTGQPVLVWTSGTINVGATLQIGEIYVLSKNGGGAISPFADLNTGKYVTILGAGLTAANLGAPGGAYATQVAHY